MALRTYAIPPATEKFTANLQSAQKGWRKKATNNFLKVLRPKMTDVNKKTRKTTETKEREFEFRPLCSAQKDYGKITFSESRCRLRSVGGKSRTYRSSGCSPPSVASIFDERTRPSPCSYTATLSDEADLPRSRSDSDLASDSCHHHSRTGILTFISERTAFFTANTTDLDLSALHTAISDKNLIDPGFCDGTALGISNDCRWKCGAAVVGVI